MSEIESHHHLGVLESVGLVQIARLEPEIEYLFRHALVQEAAYDSLLKQDRRALHRAVGEALEVTYSDRAESLAAQLEHHFSEAGDAQRAIRYYALAGDQAAQGYANAEALMLYSRALDFARDSADGERLRGLYLSRGRTLEMLARFDEAIENYFAMEALGQKRGDAAMELYALMGRATIRNTANLEFDPQDGKQALDHARDLARQIGDRPAETKILWNLMLNNTMTAGSPDTSAAYGEQALAFAQELGLDQQAAYIMNDLWYVYVSRGELGKGNEILAQARALWQKFDALPMLSENYTRTALASMAMGRYDEALAYADQAYELGKSSDNIDAQALSRSMVGFVLLDRGEIDATLAMMRSAMTLGSQGATLTAIIGTRAEYGWVLGLLGRPEEGLIEAQAAAETAGERFAILEGWARTMRALLYLQLGDAESAAQELAAVGGMAGIRKWMGFVTIVWVQAAIAEARIMLAQGNSAAALHAVDALLKEMYRKGLRFLRPDAMHVRAQALIALGRHEEAENVLSTARSEAEGLGSRRSLWPILLALADLTEDRGSPAQAAVLRQEAQQIRHAIAESISDEALRRSFLSVT